MHKRPREVEAVLRQIIALAVPLAACAAACGSGGSDAGSTSSSASSGSSSTSGGAASSGASGCGPRPAVVQNISYTPERCDDGGVDAGTTDDAGDDAATCVPGAVPDDAGSDCYVFCPQFGFPSQPHGPVETCRVLGSDGGTFMIECTFSPPPCGRRPEGLEAPRIMGRGDAARYLAQCAFLEAASVEAFRTLTRELAAHGAPARLVRRAKRAAADEIRHARVMASLATSAGGSVHAQRRVRRRRVRSVVDVAIENVAEGCVRETYGVLAAMWQAANARDGRLRGAMDRIAKDEARHAELAWAVARWIETKLDAPARRRVRDARRAAVHQLRRELASEPTESLVWLGLPRASVAKSMLDEMCARLFES